MSKSGALILFASCLLIVGCGTAHPVIDHTASARRLADGAYEVRLQYTVTTSGGPAYDGTLFSLTTHHYADLLYVNSLDGTLSAGQIIVKTGPDEAIHTLEGLQGTVSFANGTMAVQLEEPQLPYRVPMPVYFPYPLNGLYTLRTNTPN